MEKGDNQVHGRWRHVAEKRGFAKGDRCSSSNNFTFTSAGTYEFWAEYPPDANNNADTSDCGSETVFVAESGTTTTTQVKNAANDANVANDASVPLGTSVYDTATVSTIPARIRRQRRSFLPSFQTGETPRAAPAGGGPPSAARP